MTIGDFHKILSRIDKTEEQLAWNMSSCDGEIIMGRHEVEDMMDLLIRLRAIVKNIEH